MPTLRQSSRSMAGSQAAGLAYLLLMVIYSYSGVDGLSTVSTTTPNQSVKENGTVTFVCTNNFQNPTVKWKFVDRSGFGKLVYMDNALTEDYKNRAEISPTYLKINDLTRKDTGNYTCDVSDSTSGTFGEAKIQLIVQVPPSMPIAHVPHSVKTGSAAELRCIERDGSPPPTYTWFKGPNPLPTNPQSVPTFQNSSYTLDPNTGVLLFFTTTHDDAGEYSCTATNSLGKASSEPVRLQVYDTNVGGIVAAVIIVLLLLALIGVGIWYACSRGYIGKKSGTGKKVIYSTPSDKSDRNFQQTSSFLV